MSDHQKSLLLLAAICLAIGIVRGIK